MTKKTILKIIGCYVLLVGGMFLILMSVNWYLLKQEAVRIGMARPNFPYTKYSQDELNEMYPQYPNENVATTQTPEETYAKFIAALKAGDIDGAMKLFTDRKREKYREAFLKDQKENKLSDSVKDLDVVIKVKEQFGVFANYWLGDESKNYTVEFIKGADGVWEIDSL